MDEINRRVFDFFDVSETSPEWNDWHWQYKNRIKDVETLSRVCDMSDEEKLGVAECLKKIPHGNNAILCLAH